MTDKEKGTPPPPSNTQKAPDDIVVSGSQNSMCEEAEPCPTDDVKQQRRRNLFTTRILPFFGLQLALFIAVLDMYVDTWKTVIVFIVIGHHRTILATSLPRISSEFHAMTLSVWVASA